MKHHTKERVRGLRLLPFYLFTFLLFLAACTQIDCPVQNTVLTHYSLLKADGNPDTLGVDTLWLWTKQAAKGRKDTLLNALTGSKATDFDLQISQTLPEDTICLAVVDTIGTTYLDTIRIKKDNYPHFESVDCQASYFHTITGVSYTNDIIDSIVINNPNVNYDTQTTHFKLYLKARR